MARSGRSRLAAIAAVLLLWLPAVAEACSVCFSGKGEDSVVAFRITTAFMTFLPLFGVAGVAWWLRRRARELALSGEAVESADAGI